MLLRTPVALAIIALNAPLFALAQSSSSTASTGDDIVVTASRAPETARAAVRPVQVITAEDIRVSGAGTLADALATLGGVDVVTSGGMGQAASVFIRGSNSGHAVVLVDGVRIGSASLGSVPLQNLPLALVERVEILAGPSSSLYGSDAIGGVIQVFTKSAQRSPGVNVAVTAGEQGLGQIAGSYAQRLGDTELSLGANLLNTDGYNITTPANVYSYNPDKDGYRDLGLNARVVQHLSADQQVGLQFLRSASIVHFDSGADYNGKLYDDLSRERTQTLAAHWQGQLAANVQSTLRLGRSWDQSTTEGAYPSVFNTTQDQASWLNHVALSGGTLSAGLEWLRQAVDGSMVYSGRSRDVTGGLLGWRGSYGALAVQADARVDHNSQFGTHGTGQFGLAYQLTPALRLRGSLGTAFKAPTFNDLYYPDSYGTHGNPDLQPERSTSGELGADLALGGLTLSATAFDSRIRDLIQWVETPAGSYAYIPANTARAKIQGLTLQATGALGADTRIKAGLTFQNPEDADSGAQLQRRARQLVNLHLSHAIGPVSVGTDLNWVGARWDSTTEATGTRMGGYGLVALFATWHLTPDWSLEGRVNNLADRNYTQVQGYVPQPRQAQVTLRWTPAL